MTLLPYFKRNIFRLNNPSNILSVFGKIDFLISQGRCHCYLNPCSIKAFFFKSICYHLENSSNLFAMYIVFPLWNKPVSFTRPTVDKILFLLIICSQRYDTRREITFSFVSSQIYLWRLVVLRVTEINLKLRYGLFRMFCNYRMLRLLMTVEIVSCLQSSISPSIQYCFMEL